MMGAEHPVEIRFKHVSRYHYYCFIILFLSIIPMIWQILSLIFLSPPMKFQCSNNARGQTNECPCDEPNWNRSVFTETVQTKFNIICEHEWMVSFTESILNGGTLIGGLIIGFLGDKHGRLFMFSVSALELAIAGCLISFMNTITLYIIMRFLAGIGLGGVIVTGFVYLIEYCGTSYRDTVAALYHLILNVGHVTLAGVSYYIRDCDIFQLAISIPMLLTPFFWILLYESPKWLVDSGRIEQAAAVMKKIDKFNNTSLCDDIETEMQNYYEEQESKAHAKVSLIMIFKHKRFTINFLCMSGINLICGTGYYGVSQYIGHMSGDIHRNVAISGLMLIPGSISTIFLLKILGRRIFLMITNALAGILMISAISTPADVIFTRMIVASLANTCFFVSFIIIFLYSVELFPTSVRNSVLGVLSIFTRIGQIIAPPINSLNAIAAGVIFGFAAVLGAVLCYPLPETKGVALPSTLEDSTAIRGTLFRSSISDSRITKTAAE